jgi:hypothetical protein
MDINFNEFVDLYKEQIEKYPPPMMETVQELFIFLDASDSFQEFIDGVKQTADINPLSAMEKLNALERLLADPPKEEGALAHMVAWRANWVLDDPSDEGAMKWLREVAEAIREVLGDRAPPRVE